MKNIKKNWYLYLIILLVICFGAFLVYKFAFSEKISDTKLIDIKMTDLEAKIENKESFILVISQTGCSHCEQYLPELDRTLKEINLEANVLNITNLNTEEKITLSKYANFSGTPTTLFFTDGEEKTSLNRIIGYASKAKIKERLSSLGYIK
ncbi:MAG: thioredoxin family protein [Bacilli bacterium]|jgi:thioredoxin-related protein|nr:thioredoxin family protein [Bacilli bacterium]